MMCLLVQAHIADLNGQLDELEATVAEVAGDVREAWEIDGNLAQDCERELRQVQDKAADASDELVAALAWLGEDEWRRPQGWPRAGAPCSGCGLFAVCECEE